MEKDFAWLFLEGMFLPSRIEPDLPYELKYALLAGIPEFLVLAPPISLIMKPVWLYPRADLVLTCCICCTESGLGPEYAFGPGFRIIELLRKCYYCWSP